MQLDIYNITGEKTGRSIELPNEIFGVESNDHSIYLAVKQYLAAQRQGTHKVKTRAEVKGSSRKLHKQKGTGGARKGNIRNPLYKGGGTIFGPKPHLYHIKLNRKVKDLAKISALSTKAKENSIMVIEDITMESPKTKTFVNALAGFNLTSKKTMLITPDYDETIYLSSRNITRLKVSTLSDINTYDIMNSSMLMFTESAAKILSEEPAEA
jgi:large subunit ribosomal protein L4